MSGTRWRIRALLVSATLAVMLVLVPAASAQANTPVLISTDGVTYSSTLPAPLFSSLHRVIPRESLTAALYVKNPTNRPVAVALNVADVGGGLQIASAFTVSATARGGLSTPVNLGAVGACVPLLAELSLPANGQTVVHLSLTMTDVSGTIGQNQTVRFNVHVSMRDAAAPAPSDACAAAGADVTGLGPSHSTASGPLAFTGLDATGPLVVASLLVGVGLAFWLTAVRRKGRAEK